MAKSVKVYSTPSCHYCVEVKQFLRENNVEFEEIDVSTDQSAAEEMTQKSGQLGAPVLDIDGEIIVGFDQEKIKSALSQ